MKFLILAFFLISNVHNSDNMLVYIISFILLKYMLVLKTNFNNLQNNHFLLMERHENS